VTDAPDPSPIQPTASTADDEAKARLGWVLYGLGALTFPLGLGLGLGYWVADRGVRWVPSMVGVVLATWIGGLLLLVAGTYALGPLRGNRHGRKRTVVFGTSIVVAAVLYAGAKVLSQPTPLTSMPPQQFERSFAADALLYRDLDRALAGVVALLDAQEGVFTPVAGEAPVLTADQEAAVAGAWDTFVHVGARLDHVRRFYEDYHHFDLSRLERDRHLRSYLLTFAAELALYERTAQLIERVDRNPNVASFLNVPRPQRRIPENSYAYVREELAGLTDLSRVVAGKQYLGWLNAMHAARAEAERDGYGWLWHEVEVHLARLGTRRGSELASLTIAADVAPLKKRIKAWSFPVQAEVAEWMGDTRMRRPGRYLIGPQHLEPMEEVLLPGDVLLGRKNWYLSNFGLPGFWPHGLLYVGSPAKLAAAFDDDDGVRDWVRRQTGQDMPFTAFLAMRHPRAWADLLASDGGEHPLVVIEAISEGVVLNSWEHAAGDYLVAMRPKLEPWVRAQALHRAWGYLGRPYDFDFDFATDHALVCTELVWRSYRPLDGGPGLTMAPIKVAGRRALPANEIARLFQTEHGTPGAQLEFVYFLDAREKTQQVLVGDEASFLETPDRPQWDFAQE
jgi:hypothetical protein